MIDPRAIYQYAKTPTGDLQTLVYAVQHGTDGARVWEWVWLTVDRIWLSDTASLNALKAKAIKQAEIQLNVA